MSSGRLSLLAATCLIDLHADGVAEAHLCTAAQLARETGHAEIAAWVLETRAWQALTAGDYRHAADLARAAQQVAPRGGSAHWQGRRARYRGTRKNLFDLRRIAVVHNVQIIRPQRPNHRPPASHRR